MCRRKKELVLRHKNTNDKKNKRQNHPKTLKTITLTYSFSNHKTSK